MRTGSRTGQLGAGHNVSVEPVVDAVLRAIREPDERGRAIARTYFGFNPFSRDGGPADELWLGAWRASIDGILASDEGGKINAGPEKTDG
jgi:hypothetical protein